MSDREEEIRRLYASALQRPIGERTGFVIEQSGRDDDLRRRVDALLAGQQDTELPGGGVASGAVLASGTQIGSYRIDGPLGAGGMGIVYRATDTKLDRPAAVKVLPENLADPEARRRFQREARMVSSLNHPHIVTVYDAGEYDDRQYLITEYVDGGTLRQWAAYPRGWQQIIELLVGVADGIAVAHAAGILHRDIKPENILLAKNGYAKLADFGLAKLLEVDPLADDVLAPIKPGDNSTLIGTAAYMSPEQAQGRALDGRSDVYAFGLVLHELLSGKRPDREPRLGTSALAPLGADVPAPLRSIVAKALEPEPADRYQTMRELVVDLRRLARRSGLEDDLQSGPVDARVARTSSAPLQPRPRWRLLSPWYVAVAAVLTATWLAFDNRQLLPGSSAGLAVAVLPFANEATDADDVISEGLGDTLRERLMALPGLSVQARASSVIFRDRGTDMRTVAESLKVEVLINGSLRRRGSTLEVSVAVLDRRGFAKRPALKFQRAERELQALQQQIAAEIAALLLPSAQASLVTPPTPPTDQSERAHLLLQFGNRVYYEVREEPIVDKLALDTAIGHYRRATQEDPSSIAAHARLATALLYNSDIEGAQEPLTKALELGKSLDPSAASTALSDLHYAIGLYWFATRQPGSELQYQEALRLNPNNAEAFSGYAGWLYGHKRAPEADAYFRDAIRHDLQSLSQYAAYALYLGTTDEIDKLHALGHDIEQRFPNASGYRELARLYELTGELDIGIAWGLKAYDLEPDEDTKRQIAELFARIGDFEMAQRWEPEPGVGQLWLQRRFAELIEIGELVVYENPDDLKSRYLLAFAYNATGDFRTAHEILERIAAPLSSETFQGPIDAQLVTSLVDVLRAREVDDSRATRIAQERADWLTAAIENGTERSWWQNTLLACTQVQLGKRADALDTLERVVESHGLVWSPMLQDSPCFKRLAEEPRYQQVVARIEERKRVLRERLPTTLSAHGVSEVVPQ